MGTFSGGIPYSALVRRASETSDMVAACGVFNVRYQRYAFNTSLVTRKNTGRYQGVLGREWQSRNQAGPGGTVVIAGREYTVLERDEDQIMVATVERVEPDA